MNFLRFLGYLLLKDCLFLATNREPNGSSDGMTSGVIESNQDGLNMR
jgi:hypothetical protein